MAKVSGSYKSLIRGVSEQVPEERLPGQHAAQDNTLSDPVRGLIRRQGSLLVNETAVQHTTADDLAASYRGEDIKIEDRELTVLLRRPAAAPGSGNGHNHDHSGHAAHATGPAVWALQRGAYPGSTDGTVLDTYLTSAAVAELASGVTAHAVVGRFLLLAPAGVPAPIIARLHADTAASLAEAELRAQLSRSGFDVMITTPEQTATLLRVEHDRWAPILPGLNLQMD